MFGNAVSRSFLLFATLVVALGAVSTTGCSFGEVYFDDPLLRAAALMDTQKRYTDLVRWSAFHKAAVYVEPEERTAFVEEAPSFKEFRFTDYESEPVDLDEEGEATIRVTYYGYRTSSPFEVEVIETQHWKRSGLGNDWFVHSEFKGLAKSRGLARSN